MRVQPIPEQLTQLIDALLSAFEHDELKQLVSFELDDKLEWFTPVAGKRDLRTIVSELLLYYASQEGGLRRLLTAARKMNDGNELLEQVEHDWDGLEFAPLALSDDHPHQTIIHGDSVGGDKVDGDKVGGDKIIQNFYPPQPDPESTDPAPGDPPYLGLNYFTADDAHLFFGRNALTSELVAQLDSYNQSETRFLAVIGASGSGKSSLVRAGLVPALARGEIDGSDRWTVHVITPKALPLESLALSLTDGSESVTATATLMDDMVAKPNSLHLYTRRLMNSTPEGTRLLLVVDQFEELFTLCKDPEMQQHFVDNLMTAATTDGPTVVVLTLRADFYAQCARFDDLRTVIKKQQEYIGAMTEDELRQAIVEPAEKNGWDFEAGLIDLILKDVGNEPGALPLLSHALHETWKRRRGHTLTHDGYKDVGGVNGAIAKTADHIYDGLTAEQQTIARTIFIRLTELGEGSEDTRRRVALSELQPTDGEMARVDEVLKELADARLVTTHETEAEVAHEALIREWDTLRKWLDSDRDDLRILRRLTEEATEWGDNQDTSLLYRGARREEAQRLAATNMTVLSGLEERFLDASSAEEERVIAEREQLQREREEAAERELAQAKVASNRARLAALAALVALLAVLGVSIYGYIEYQNRQEQALEDKKIADAQSFVQEARDLTNNLQAKAAIAKLNDAIILNPALELDIDTESLDIRRTVAISLTTQGEALLRSTQEADDEELWQSSFISATTLFTQAYALDPPPEAAVYVRIPAGEFEMGSDESDELAYEDREFPQHKVSVAEFWMGRTEVTKAQYKRCVTADVCEDPSDSQYEDERYANDPVVGVTWYQASAYARWVGGRLPTEAEWEYACRGTTDSIYPWGNDKPTVDLLNYSSSPGSSTAPVGRYPDGVSPFGLYDMVGNVWEWTSTKYQDYPYNVNDGREDQSGNSLRTLRGGSFNNSDGFVRCASRVDDQPDNDLVNFGFRIVVVSWWQSPGFLSSENSGP